MTERHEQGHARQRRVSASASPCDGQVKRAYVGDASEWVASADPRLSRRAERMPLGRQRVMKVKSAETARMPAPLRLYTR